MAAAILPALQTGGRMVLSNLPSVVSAVKSKLPGVYDKVVAYTSKSNKTPEQVVQTAVAKNDKYLGQAVIETMMRNGVTAEFINQAAPVFPIAELKRLETNFHNIDKLERQVADTGSADIQGDPDEVFAHDNAHIVRLCRAMGITSDTLVDLRAFIKTRGPAQIVRYQKFERAAGRRPV